MRILVLFNPVSGGGRAARHAGRVAGHLKGRGHECTLRATQPVSGWSGDLLAASDALVVAGGDGAVRLAAASAMRTGVPVYHLPCGTANLLARRHGMTCDPSAVAAALEGGERLATDVGMAGDEPFLLMAGVGIDARIVHALHQRRRGGISKLSYVMPAVRESIRWRGERVAVEVDGTAWTLGAPGTLLIANSPAYAEGIDPVRTADETDGLLDAAWMPAHHAGHVLAWAYACWRRTQSTRTGWQARRGTRMSVSWRHAHGAPRLQLDGDAVPLPPEGIDFTILPRALALALPRAG
jgi:diacylglycerol kinase family enzyme